MDRGFRPLWFLERQSLNKQEFLFWDILVCSSIQTGQTHQSTEPMLTIASNPPLQGFDGNP